MWSRAPKSLNLPYVYYGVNRGTHLLGAWQGLWPLLLNLESRTEGLQCTSTLVGIGEDTGLLELPQTEFQGFGNKGTMALSVIMLQCWKTINAFQIRCTTQIVVTYMYRV